MPYICKKSDKRKLQQLVPKKGSEAINQILRDIYSCQYGSIKEYGLADSKDPNDLNERIEKLKYKWEELCPGFINGSWRNAKIFLNRVLLRVNVRNLISMVSFVTTGLNHNILKKKKSNDLKVISKW